jgi:hypothetical protein
MIGPEVSVLAVFVGVVLFGWAPLLAVDRLRALFCWPTRWLAVNYLVVGAAVVVLQVASYVLVVLLGAGMGPVTGGEAAAVVGGVLLANVALPAVAAFLALRVLPPRGVWTPEGDGLSGRVALGIGVLWYAILTSGSFLLIGLVVLVANLPT